MIQSKGGVMGQINVMMSGLPGNVTRIIAEHIEADNRFDLMPVSLTGPGIPDKEIMIREKNVALVLPEAHKERLISEKEKNGDFIIVDFTHPTAVNANAALYAELGIPFVMGTTGGDREGLIKTVENSQIAAVIAPNMVKQIVGLQDMLTYAAENFNDLFKGFTLDVVESHQKGKADTSGTAKALVGLFKHMGVDYDMESIRKVRDPEVQKNEWNIPEEYLGGHGWHTYTLTSPDKNMKFQFVHNINGRNIYAPGTMDAVCYLDKKVKEGAKGAVFSMIDVLKNK